MIAPISVELSGGRTGPRRHGRRPRGRWPAGPGAGSAPATSGGYRRRPTEGEAHEDAQHDTHRPWTDGLPRSRWCSRADRLLGSNSGDDGASRPRTGDSYGVPSPPPPTRRGTSRSATPTAPRPGARHRRRQRLLPLLEQLPRARGAKELGAKVDDRSCGGARPRTSTQPVPRRTHPSSTRSPDATWSPSASAATTRACSARWSALPRAPSQGPRGAPCRTAMRVGREGRLLGALARTSRSSRRCSREVHRRAPEARVLVVGLPPAGQADSRAPSCRSPPVTTGTARGQPGARRRRRRGRGDRLDVRRRVEGQPGPRHLLEGPVGQRRRHDQKRAARYHPFAEEQRAVAHLVLDQVSH